MTVRGHCLCCDEKRVVHFFPLRDGYYCDNCIEKIENENAPGHTDLMVTPESIDKWLGANPLPDEAMKGTK